MSDDGPKEKAVRDTLTNRPAGELTKLEREDSRCFTAMFNGAHTPGRIFGKMGLKCGKAECEWNWPEGWKRLQDAGLIEFNIVTREPASFDEVHFRITGRGHTVREDDIKWFNELMAARHADEADSTKSQPL